MTNENTTPHDYRVLMSSVPGLTVVGGQAVNLWAITYCGPDDNLPDHGSKDLDVIARGEVARAIQQLPNWDFKKTPLWTMDVRVASLTCRTSDGRLLAVEVLNRVNGLDGKDLAATRIIESGGIRFQVLDPIAMLKAKAANVRDLKQDGDPPRQDRQHLQIIAICLPRFLLDAHAQSEMEPGAHEEFSHLLRRAFETLFDKKTAQTLWDLGIAPSSLIPALEGSRIEKVQLAIKNQLPRLREMERELRSPR